MGDAGDAALAGLFRSQYGALVALARVLSGDADSAEDAVQEAFVRVRVAWWRVRDEDRAVGYLRRAVVNECRGRWRRRAVADRPRPAGRTPTASTPEEAAEADDRRRTVLAAIATLPPRQRECVVLRYYADLSDREIAAALGISQGSVKTHLHRATDALAHRLGGEA